MSSLNVRFAQKTRGKTDLLNCTNLPSSDSVRHNHQAAAGPRQESHGRGKTRQRVCAQAGCMEARWGAGKKACKKKKCAVQEHWGEGPLTMKRSPRYEIKTSLQWEQSRAGHSDTNSEGHYLCPRARQTSYATSLVYMLHTPTHTYSCIQLWQSDMQEGGHVSHCTSVSVCVNTHVTTVTQPIKNFWFDGFMEYWIHPRCE